MRTTLLTIALAAPVLAQGPSKACPPALFDAANPQDCIPASTVPTAGALLPLGPELFVAPTGEVGIGTMAPEAGLDVVGSLRADGRIRLGNDTSFGPTPTWDWNLDFSQRIDDFGTQPSWTAGLMYLTLDPQIDRTGPDARYVYSHDIIVKTELGEDKDFEYIQGPYMLALHEGSSNVNILGGSLLGAENNHGTVDWQGGAYMVSVVDWEAVTQWNAAGECQSGHWGTTGHIVNDHGLYVWRPDADAPLINHYGIFLEDQDYGQQDSYAIYSAGGTTYLAGDLGIGTDTPAAKLDVNGDFVASGTKSFVQEHPYDPSKEIRFVCLEGNEAGTYFRGSAKLSGGEAVIYVPEDFALVTDAQGMTVQLTPFGPGADLYVASRDLDRIVVRGAADVEFDYFVNGVRSGYAEFQTIRDRAQQTTNAAKRGARGPESVRAERRRRMYEGRE